MGVIGPADRTPGTKDRTPGPAPITPHRPPPAEGVRLEWADLPERVRAVVERWLGCPVVGAWTQPTGFSPGVAARLKTADGRRVFVKAVGPEPNPEAVALHRDEAR